VNRRQVITRLMAAASIPCCGAPAAASEGANWSYTGATGPTHWGALEQDFATCSIGHKQSPVNLSSANATNLGPIQANYSASPLHILNNGHTIQVNYKIGSWLVILGAQHRLMQFHFHSPSEHTVNGKQYPMEAHFVHVGPQGQAAVLAVFLKEGYANDTIQMIWNSMPAKPGPERVIFNTSIRAKHLIPSTASYYDYVGSLTTPPCTQGVNWIVLTAPLQVSAAQIARFRQLYPMNARPLQPLNGRPVILSTPS